MYFCPICEKYLDCIWIQSASSLGYYICPKGHYSIFIDINESIVEENLSYKNYIIINKSDNTCKIFVGMIGIINQPVGEPFIISGRIDYDDKFEEKLQNHLLLV